MSAEDYAATTVEALLQRFAGTAKRLGLGYACRDHSAASGEGPPSKTEKRRAFADARAIADALRARASEREIELLFETDDPDVRLCASLLLGDLAAELSQAAQYAAIASLSTRAVLREARRARTPPPLRPTLQEMGDDALLGRFQDAGERLTGCAFIDTVATPKDFQARDRIVAELAAIRVEIERRGMLTRLEPFLDSKDPRIRFQAALGCLSVVPEKAVTTLQALAENADPNTQISAVFILRRRGDNGSAARP